MKIVPPNRKIAILLSGRGSNFMAIADHIRQGALQAEIAVVMSDNESAPGLAQARRDGLDSVFVSPQGRSREAFDGELGGHLQERDVGLVCLAGFMRILSSSLIHRYSNRILNIHPSLLPAFPGLDAQRQAVEHGVKFSGCTVHFVDASLDGGPIVRQAPVPVLEGDSVEDLSARILAQEHRLYSEAIQIVLDGRCALAGRRVIIRE